MLFKVFGRITAAKEDCQKILEDYYDPQILAVMEGQDDTTMATHCHYIAFKEAKSMKNLRQNLSNKCVDVLNEKNKYSVKLYDDAQDAEAYICKGKDPEDLFPNANVIINTLNVDTEAAHERYWEMHKEMQNKKQTKAIWKQVTQDLEKFFPEIFLEELTRGTSLKIASFLYDWYIQNERLVQGKYQQQTIINTIIIHKFKNKTLKRLVCETWVEDACYWNGMAMEYHPDVKKVIDKILPHDNDAFKQA